MKQEEPITLNAEVIQQEETINNPSYELTTIDETKFLALTDYEDKLKKLVEENPFIEVTDKTSLKIAEEREKKFREARLELRTTGKSESQERMLVNMLNKAKQFVTGKIDYLVLIPETAETRQKKAITEYKDKEKIAKEKAEAEAKKVTDAILEEIKLTGEALQKIIDEATFETMEKIEKDFQSTAITTFDFKEMAFMYEEMFEEKRELLRTKYRELESAEETRLENLKKDQEAKLNEALIVGLEVLKKYTGSEEDGDLVESMEELLSFEFDFGDLTEDFLKKKEEFIQEAKDLIVATYELKVKTEKLRVFEVQEGLLDLITQLTIGEIEETKKTIQEALEQPHMEEVEERFKAMKVVIEKALADKLVTMNDELLKHKADGIKLQAEKDKTTDMRIKLLKKVGLKVEGDFLVGYYDIKITRTGVQDMEEAKFNEIIAFMKKKKEYAEKEEKRQKKLKKDKLKMSDLFLSIRESIDEKEIVFENEESKELYSTLTEQFKECIESFEKIINEF